MKELDVAQVHITEESMQKHPQLRPIVASTSQLQESIGRGEWSVDVFVSKSQMAETLCGFSLRSGSSWAAFSAIRISMSTPVAPSASFNPPPPQPANTTKATRLKSRRSKKVKEYRERFLEEREVLLTDWGIAQFQQEPEDKGPADSRKIRGTPPYMSPEQANGGVVDERTDIWGLGATLYAIAALHVRLRQEFACRAPSCA